MGGSGANGLKTMHLHHFKEVLFVNKRYMKGEPFLSKMVYYKRVTGWPPGVKSPYLKLRGKVLALK